MSPVCMDSNSGLLVGAFRRYYKKCQKIEDEIRAVADQNKTTDAWLILQRKGQIVEIAKAFESGNIPALPILPRDRRFWRFEDMIFDALNCRFLTFEEAPGNAVSHFDKKVPAYLQHDLLLKSPFFRFVYFIL